MRCARIVAVSHPIRLSKGCGGRSPHSSGDCGIAVALVGIRLYIAMVVSVPQICCWQTRAYIFIYGCVCIFLREREWQSQRGERKRDGVSEKERERERERERE